MRYRTKCSQKAAVGTIVPMEWSCDIGSRLKKEAYKKHKRDLEETSVSQGLFICKNTVKYFPEVG